MLVNLFEFNHLDRRIVAAEELGHSHMKEIVGFVFEAVHFLYDLVNLFFPLEGRDEPFEFARDFKDDLGELAHVGRHLPDPVDLEFTRDAVENIERFVDIDGHQVNILPVDRCDERFVQLVDDAAFDHIGLELALLDRSQLLLDDRFGKRFQIREELHEHLAAVDKGIDLIGEIGIELRFTREQQIKDIKAHGSLLHGQGSATKAY